MPVLLSLAREMQGGDNGGRVAGAAGGRQQRPKIGLVLHLLQG